LQFELKVPCLITTPIINAPNETIMMIVRRK